MSSIHEAWCSGSMDHNVLGRKIIDFYKRNAKQFIIDE
jgi:hypothetical protein